MSWVESNLAPNERVIEATRIHWAVLIAPILAFLFGFLMMWGANTESDTNPSLWVSGFGFFSIGIASFAKAAFEMLTTELVVTNRRILARSGFLTRRTLELNLTKLETIEVEEDILGRLFGYGTVTVTGTGGARTPFRGIEKPGVFRRRALEQADANATQVARPRQKHIVLKGAER